MNQEKLQALAEGLAKDLKIFHPNLLLILEKAIEANFIG